jgi:L-lactate dehydrogenase complex protein LldE
VLTAGRKLPAGRRVLLMGTCLGDCFFDEAGRATVEVLEHLGYEVAFPEGQTCCGQPAFNAGDWEASRKVVRHALEVFSGEDPVVVPSGSCAAMFFHGAKLAFEHESDLDRVKNLAGRTWEICDFLVHAAGVKRWPGRMEASAVLHRSCHTRGTGSGDAALRLLGLVEGLRVWEPAEAEQCCGFGGLFSVSFPHLSGAIGERKREHLDSGDPDYLVSTDMGCLMHLIGLREGKAPWKPRHVCEILTEALKTGAT